MANHLSLSRVACTIPQSLPSCESKSLSLFHSPQVGKYAEGNLAQHPRDHGPVQRTELLVAQQFERILQRGAGNLDHPGEGAVQFQNQEHSARNR